MPCPKPRLSHNGEPRERRTRLVSPPANDVVRSAAPRSAGTRRGRGTIGAARFVGAALLENATVGLALSTPQGFIARVNRSIADMLGYTPDELRGVHFATIAYPDDVDATRVALTSLLTGERTTYRYDKRYLHRDGRGIWSDVSVFSTRQRGHAPVLHHQHSGDDGSSARRGRPAQQRVLLPGIPARGPRRLVQAGLRHRALGVVGSTRCPIRHRRELHAKRVDVACSCTSRQPRHHGPLPFR